jgi:peroxiredoxin
MRKNLLILSFIASIFAFTAMIYPNFIPQESSTLGYNIGDKAIDFSLKNATNNMNGIGKNVSLKDYNNIKGYIVIFTCNHCPFSIAYEDRIIDLHKKYAPEGYPVIAINPNDVNKVPDDSYANMKIRVKEKGFPFAYLFDETQAIAKAYGATKTPHVYILEKRTNDNIVRYIGAIDDNTYEATAVKEKYVENAIDALLNGKSVQKTETRAIGCTIKWKS